MQSAISTRNIFCENLPLEHCEHIRSSRPRFSWKTDEVVQQCNLQLAASLSDLQNSRNLLWDSIIDGTENLQHPYSGLPLQPAKTYYFQMRTQTNGQWNAFSKPMALTMDQTLDQAPFSSSCESVKEVKKPQQFNQTAANEYFADFGRSAFGALYVTLESPAEQTITLMVGEVLAQPMQIDQEPGGYRCIRQCEIAVKPGIHTYRMAFAPHKNPCLNPPPSSPTPRCAEGEIVPFRYAQIKNFSGTVVNIEQWAIFYPFDLSASEMNSDNMVLNAVYELCKYSMKGTSVFGEYVDGERERVPYEADAYINALSHFAVDSSYSIAGKTFERFFTHPTWPVEWIMFTVMIGYEYYLYSGDLKLLEHYFEQLKGKTLECLELPNGLISTAKKIDRETVVKASGFDGELRDIVDWPMNERDNYEFNEINTVPNCFHFYVMDIMAKISKLLNKKADEEYFSQRAKLIKDSIHNLLFDPESGLYIDSVNSKHASLHSNIFAVALNVARPEELAKIGEFIQSKNLCCSVYAVQFLLEAVYRCQLGQYGLEVMSGKSLRSWFNMIDKGSTMTMEAWDNSLKPNQDWNHAWGAAPGNIISRFMVGIRPTAGGFREFEFQPQPGGIGFLNYIFPSLLGNFELNITLDQDNIYRGSLIVPPGANGKFIPSNHSKFSINNSDSTQLHSGINQIWFENC